MITVTLGGTQRRLLHLLIPQNANSSSKKQVPSSLLCVTGNLTLLCAKTFGHIRCEKAAFVARNPWELPRYTNCKACVAIIDSANWALRKVVAQRHLPALTCGLSGKDTFTLSSWRPDGALICLRRSITAFDGTVVEPFELPVTFSEQWEPFELLAASAVFCLLGMENPLASMKHWQLEPGPEQSGS